MGALLWSIFIRAGRALSGLGIGKFHAAKVTYLFFERRLKPNVIQIDGHKIFLDSADSLNLSMNLVYEEFETKLIKQEIKKGDFVLDIGAHIGYYTLIFAKLVGENGRVFAFEPDPTNFALLMRNIETNGYKNVILEQKAVSNKTGKLKLYVRQDDTADHRIYDSHDGRQSIEIEAIRLDDYFNNYNGKIDFIKMDIQGSEPGAIQGIPLLLQKNKNLKLVTEFWPYGLKTFGTEPEEYLDTLLTYGFKIYEINERKKRIEAISDIDRFLRKYTTENKEYTNLLAKTTR